MRRLGDPLYGRLGGSGIPFGFVVGPKTRYLLQDEFITARAAGTLNGTLAEPGPGTRVVTDTGNDLSIAGGILDFAGGSGGWGDPYIVYDAIVRQAGRVFLVTVNFATFQNMQFGFDNNQVAGSLTRHFFNVGGGAAVSVTDAGVSYLGVFTGTAATEYKWLIVLRATGAFYFAKGGVFTDWTLLYVGALQATTPLYPAITNYNGVLTADSLRVPQELWLPVPILSDSFDRANGALGVTDGAGHAEANGGGGLAWNNRIGTTLIATNVASASALVGGIAIATVDAGNVDVLHEAELTRSAGNIGIVLRYVDADNYVFAYHDGTNAVLVKRVATVENTVITAVTAYAAGALIRVICDGTTFSLFYNNVKIGVTSTIADAGLQTGTEHGLYSSNTGNSQDNCVAWPRKTGYSKLDRF